MKPRIRVAFACWWPDFTPDTFRGMFPQVHDKYELVLSPAPDVVFYSVFSPQHPPDADPRKIWPVVRFRPGDYTRVLVTGENFEPDMSGTEFAITFSALTAHPNHLRLPLWVYENRGWGHGPDRIVKAADTDWDKVAAGKTGFCNFVHSQDVPYRNAIFSALNAVKRVDAAGRSMNNMQGWTVPQAPNRLAGKLEFLAKYKFTLAVENIIWPGYMTEKLADPMYVNSVPIYVGDPQARLSFDPQSYIDITSFATIKEMLDFVREADNNRDLYLKMLARPFYRDNRIPDYARDETILAFFDRIFKSGLASRPAEAP